MARPARIVPLPGRTHRRSFLARSLGGAAALTAAATTTGPGVFAAGTERLRIGLVGCGGRGTGAAVQAARACPAVEITCLADRFADQIADSVGRLAAAAGPAVRCPPERRHVGEDAWWRVLESDVDLVILATPPHLRPLQVAAAVAAGKHVWCETPGGIDVAGVVTLAAAGREARRRGLSLAAGLSGRRDPAFAEVVSRVRDHSSGGPRAVVMRHEIGVPWIRPVATGWSPAECRLRNWIWFPEFSGGHLVEHHADALDRGLWVLGDDEPLAVMPLVPRADSRPTSQGQPGVGPGPAATGGLGSSCGPICAADTAVRYLFRDGRTLDASVSRREGPPSRLEETVRGPGGTVDLRVRSCCGGREAIDPQAVGIGRLVRGVLRGDRIDDGGELLRTTHAAVLGTLAVNTGRTLAWGEIAAPSPQPERPLQSTGA